MGQKLQDLGLGAAQLVERRLTGRVIECFFTVYNTLGFGMLESV